ncbi:glycoprotease [Histoplasma ohiense]|nr:glycoprotease [Histoplasma ohiense (nom. inval.)]
MYAARAAKPKLSLSIVAAPTSNTSRPVLSLKSPVAMTMTMSPRTPLSPSPLSPTARNTKLNQRGFSTMQQQATFAYANSASSKSILKKNSSCSSSCSSSPGSGASSKRIQFNCEPTIHCVTPIENTDDYYGGYVKMSRDERRWLLRS